MSWVAIAIVILLLVAFVKLFIPFMIRRAVKGAAKRMVRNAATETRERVVETAKETRERVVEAATETATALRSA